MIEGVGWGVIVGRGVRGRLVRAQGNMAVGNVLVRRLMIVGVRGVGLAVKVIDVCCHCFSDLRGRDKWSVVFVRSV